MRGLTDSGVDVVDIGLCGTEGVYFATSAEKFDGGIMVTASHNPPDYNGMKFVREGSRPISADTGLKDMAAMIRDGALPARAAQPGSASLAGHQRAVRRAPAGLRRPQPAAQAQGRGQRRQRRRRPGRRPARAAPAVRVHQGSSRARRHLPERRAEPDARGEPQADRRRDPPQRRRRRPGLGRRLRPLLLLRRARRASSRATTSSACWRSRRSSASRARASSTTRA